MSEFERISTATLLIRDIDMARFFVKYAKENAEYILKMDEDNVVVGGFHERAVELENELSYYFDLLKLELDVDADKIETKRSRKRRKRKRRE